jgi:hypothetical protein
LEFIQVNSVTGSAAIVAEGALHPVGRVDNPGGW